MTTIAIEVNGEPRSVQEGGNVQDLIAALDLPKQAMAVAINRQIVPRQSWAQRVLQAQDKVDVVRAIGGG
ncbi:MAG: sulfur carrier protein ThiS [Burkholderiaceae bacterium]|nr:sulfur carrier protein ThiS [Burkholderiaceae bacterium]